MGTKTDQVLRTQGKWSQLPLEKLLSVQELVDILGLSKSTINAWANEGYLPCYQFGKGKKKRKQFSPSEVKEWLDKHKSEGRTTRIPKKFLEPK